MAESSDVSAAAAAVPLLQKQQTKVYYDGCPGCRIDRKKDTNTGIPYGEFIYVWIVTLCTALPISSLFPFLYFMIRDLEIAKSEEDIGYYAGYVGSSFMFGRALTSVFWGIVADRYGRKPVIVIGIVSVVIFNTLFGLSTSFWMAISTRFLLGSFNGLLGPIKAYSSEVCRPEHQSVGLSLVSTAWGIGLIIGPAIGGYLAQPAEKYPAIFSKDSLFVRFPYFLPCLSISVFAVGVLIACIWLPETLHKHGANQDLKTYESLPISECTNSKKSLNQFEEQSTGSNESLLCNWPLMSSIIVYCVFSLHDMAYTEIFSLWAVSDKTYGGLSFSSEDVGQVLAVSGFSLLVFQLSLYPPVERALGPVVTGRVGAVLSIPLLFSYPYLSKLSGTTLKFVVNCASLTKNILSVSIITGLFILQNESVKQHQRGAANGVSMTGMSLFKAVAPAGGGAIFALAQRRQSSYFLPGDQLVFFILNLVELLGLVLTFNFFLALPKK